LKFTLTPEGFPAADRQIWTRLSGFIEVALAGVSFLLTARNRGADCRASRIKFVIEDLALLDV
jgi:hypothetical protein